MLGGHQMKNFFFVFCWQLSMWNLCAMSDWAYAIEFNRLDPPWHPTLPLCGCFCIVICDFYCHHGASEINIHCENILQSRSAMIRLWRDSEASVHHQSLHEMSWINLSTRRGCLKHHCHVCVRSNKCKWDTHEIIEYLYTLSIYCF